MIGMGGEEGKEQGMEGKNGGVKEALPPFRQNLEKKSSLQKKISSELQIS